MDKLINVLQSMEDFCSFSPVSKEKISAVEQMLNLSFAQDYRDIIFNFGAISTNGHEIVGICNSKRLDVLEVTKNEKQINLRIPDTFYVIEQTNIDGIVVWQDEFGRIYQTIANSEPKLICMSLQEYLIEK